MEFSVEIENSISVKYLPRSTEARQHSELNTSLLGRAAATRINLLGRVAEGKEFLQVNCPARKCRELALELLPVFMADEIQEMRLHLLDA